MIFPCVIDTQQHNKLRLPTEALNLVYEWKCDLSLEHFMDDSILTMRERYRKQPLRL